MKIYQLREELEEYLDGMRICDDITRKEESEILDDFDEWAKTAQNGDIYFYDGLRYEFYTEYGVAVWQNEEQRENGEPMYMTPVCSKTDLEAIKQECEKYDIESTGCIEIFDKDDEWEDPILIYENGEWTNLELEQEEEQEDERDV